MKIAYIFLLLCVFTCVNLSADTKSVRIKASLDGFRQPDAKPLVISFGNFTYADDKLGSRFSTYLEDCIGEVMGQCPQYELFARRKLDEILEVQELNLSDIMEHPTETIIGRLKGVNALLSGSFYGQGKDVKVFLELIDIVKGTYVGKASFIFPGNEVPDSVSLSPANYKEAVSVKKKLEAVDKTEPADLSISAWPNRGEGGVYTEGENLVIHFKANKDCCIKLYHIDVNGKMNLIFPNKYHHKNVISKERVYSIPEKNYGFSFQLGAPFGTEFVKVVASTEQFKDIEKAFDDMGKATADKITRGLSPSQKKAGVAEKLFSYTIVPKE